MNQVAHVISSCVNVLFPSEFNTRVNEALVNVLALQSCYKMIWNTVFAAINKVFNVLI